MSSPYQTRPAATPIPGLWRSDRPRLLAALVAVGFGRAAVALGTAYLIGFAFSSMLGSVAETRIVTLVAVGLAMLAAAGAVFTALERVLAEKLSLIHI